LTSKKSVVIWVDTDGFVAAPQYRKVLLTSVVKGVGTSVQAVIADQAAGKFSSTGYNGNLKNGGTFLAPYHDLIRMVPTALRTEVTKLGAEIRKGKVSVN
jgi:basic membrane protein A